MSEKEIIEDPGRGTSGLASAFQVIDKTDAVTFKSSNSSSAFPEYFLVPIPIVKEAKLEESVAPTFEPFKSKKYRFKKALKASIRKNIDILKELSKY